jgi:hypothetical protein
VRSRDSRASLLPHGLGGHRVDERYTDARSVVSAPRPSEHVVATVGEQVDDILAQIPAVDQHCHSLAGDWALPGDHRSPGWRRCFTESVRASSIVNDVPKSTGYREFLRALSTFLGVAPADGLALEGAVARRRAVVVATEPVSYARRLFDDARVSSLLVDTGYGANQLTLPELERLIGRPVRTIVRIESIAEHCLAARPGQSTKSGQFADIFVDHLHQAVAGGAVGFKSIAAYRAGLELPDPSARQVASALRRMDRSAQSRRLEDPILVAYVVWTAARFAADRHLPLQIHIGMGDEDVHLPSADPTLLRGLFRDPSTEACRIVLLHNHPYVDHAAYLASIYPQVYVDLSLAIPLLGSFGADRAIAAARAACPANKLLAASDGHSYPEMHWRGMRLWRESLGRVLATEVVAVRLDQAEVEANACDILGRNAEHLYEL